MQKCIATLFNDYLLSAGASDTLHDYSTIHTPNNMMHLAAL